MANQYGNPYGTIPNYLTRSLTIPNGSSGAVSPGTVTNVSPKSPAPLGKVPQSPNGLYQNGILGQLTGSFDDSSSAGYMAPPSDPSYSVPEPTFPAPPTTGSPATSSSTSTSGGTGPDLLLIGDTALSLIPGIGGAVGLLGGVLNGVFGGEESKRLEDPITTEALKRLTSARDSITNIDPEANRRMTDQTLATQQGAAVQNALNASQSQLANQGVGGDIVAPNVGAIANSTAAVGAAGQFAGARSQNNMHAIEMEQQRAQQLNQNAADYGAQAAQVNLLHQQKQNFGSTLGNALLGGIAGAGSGGGILGQLGQVVTKDKTKIKVGDSTTG